MDKKQRVVENLVASSLGLSHHLESNLHFFPLPLSSPVGTQPLLTEFQGSLVFVDLQQLHKSPLNKCGGYYVNCSLIPEPLKNCEIVTKIFQRFQTKVISFL